MPTALIALGGNLSSSEGPPAATLGAAADALSGIPGTRVTAISRFFATPAHPAGSGPDYVNAAAAVETDLQPEALLAELHRIEAHFGRHRDGQRWAAREIDLDLLALDDRVLPDAATQDAWRGLDDAAQRRETPTTLILPHPRIQDRAFVLVPLVEVAPGWIHPRTGLSVAAMLARLPEDARAAARPLDQPAHPALTPPARHQT